MISSVVNQTSEISNELEFIRDYVGLEFLPSSTELRAMLEAFAPISHRFQIYTFCPTKVGEGQRGWGIGDTMTYYMGLPNEEILHINNYDRNMAAFPSAEHTDYQKVLTILRRLSLSNDLGPRNDNWRAEQLFRLDVLER
jgi:hypothetical protein